MLHSPTQPQQIGFTSPISNQNMMTIMPNHSGNLNFKALTCLNVIFKKYFV